MLRFDYSVSYALFKRQIREELKEKNTCSGVMIAGLNL
jgi:hypothetical protein